MAIRIRRREFIVALGGAVIAWPLAARAQQPDRVRRIGVLMSVRAPCTTAGFRKMLARLGVVAGIEFPIHPHMLRHGTGFKLANDGVDTRAIQDCLGHIGIARESAIAFALSWFAVVMLAGVAGGCVYLGYRQTPGSSGQG